MMEYTLLKSALWGNKTQKMLAFLTIFLASMLVASMLNITLGIGDKVALELRSYGSNIIVLPKGGALSMEIEGKTFKPLQEDAYLDESKLPKIKEVFWRNNIAAYAPFLEGKIAWSKETTPVAIVGTYFDKNLPIADEPNYRIGVKSLYPFWSVDGAWIEDDTEANILVGETLAKEHHIAVGDTLMLADKSLHVKGILKGAQEVESKIMMSMALAQTLLGKPEKISRVEVSALTVPEDDLSMKAKRNPAELDTLEYDHWYCTAYVSSIAYQIEEEYKGATAKALMKVSDGESKVVKKIQSLMGMVSIIALIAASIGIASLMASEIHRRKKEIGLLKALGASNLAIYTLFIAESLSVALIAGTVGALVGYGLSMLIALSIFGHAVDISWIILPLTISFALIIAFVGSLLPMRSVIDLLPAEVLYGRK